MNTNKTSVAIDQLIHKIQNLWLMANTPGGNFSTIDRDILLDSIRRLYELILEIEIKNNTAPLAPASKDSPARKKKSSELQAEMIAVDPDLSQADHNETLPDNDSAVEKSPAPEKTPHLETTDEAPVSTHHEKEKQSIVSSMSASPEVELSPKKNHAQQHKSAIDQFEARKTLSDLFQDGRDNSLAAKINQNHIEDIRTAIGINDKFLLINQIFEGQLSDYNQAIEKLNSFSRFHDALIFLDLLREKTMSSENEASFKKLLEIVKRKFH